MEAETVLLVFVVGVIAGVCPLHLFPLCLHLKTSTSQAVESTEGESTKLWVDHYPDE